MKKALITGITGQDGSYLTELLLDKEYEVHGIVRHSSSFNRQRIDHLALDNRIIGKKLFLHYGDLVDASSLNRILEKVCPDEIYNLAAQSHVKVSFEVPDYTAQVDALGTLRFLDAIREVGLSRQTKFYQASTSELFGKVQQIPQSEETPFYPRSPYAVAKIFGFWIVKNYREAYGLFAVNGILFNHESPRRGETFVTRKISIAACKIVLGMQASVKLGNLNSKRDWGFAPDYCEGMWKMLQANNPDDFVLATGETHSIRDFCEESFKLFGIKIKWEGGGENEVGIIESVEHEKIISLVKKVLNNSWEIFLPQVLKKISLLKIGKILIEVSSVYYRPTEVDLLIGDYSKAKKTLDWSPQIGFTKLVEIIVESDFKNFVEQDNL